MPSVDFASRSVRVDRRGLSGPGVWSLTSVMFVMTVMTVGCTEAVSERPGVGGKASARAPIPVAARVEDPGETVVEFTLTDQAGERFDSGSLAGRVWVGSVFFANCPGPCFRENQAIADILREIDDPRLVAVSLTCDPENDTPEVLRRYADRFDADLTRWKFLTGDMATIKRIANDGFRLPAEVGVHSERGVVFDRQGRLRGGYHLLQPDRVDLLKKLIREVLAEEPAAAAADEQSAVAPAAGDAR
jgi:cytochrome oxidase Cu insertion factor (SCO1/SenC/PrrC family)